jgi:ABC-type bacteriocin/lantibiotic exporter with double-glycine peptidase domain
LKHQTSIRALVFLAIAALCVLAFAGPTFAQCVMCRASLGNNSSFLRTFNIGVLVLLVPPVSLFCAIFVIAIRYRRSG